VSVVGIDLGTTNTVVASMRSGRVNVLGDESGQRLLPSVVSFHPNGEVLVGNPAKARRAMDPRNTVASHKRLLGRSWNSPEIVQARSRVPYELREGPAQGPLVHARGKDYTLPEISAFVLKRAKQIAETALGEPVMRAVITVPAHFNELQRASTKVAGRVSGLEVLRILNEPTAAALAYGLGRVGSERIAVYDFGGGTFDCTLLDLNNNVFEVLATAGDTFLGGDDVDAAIAERMAERLLKQHRIDAKADPGTWERLRAAAEELKIQLSTRDQAQVKINDLGYGVGGAALALTFAMTRGELDQLIQPLVDRTFRVTQDALALARLTPTSFDKVVLVGGSSRIPLVRRRVEAFFGAPPMDRINPDEVVAMGAAIQASALTDGAGKRPIPAPPPVPSANPHTLRGLQDEEFTQVKPPSTASAPPYATGSAPPPLGQRESNPPYASRSAPPPLGDTTSTGVTHDANRFGSVSGAIHDPRRDDEPSIPSFSGAPVPPHSEFYEAVKGSRPRLDEIEDSEAGWVTADDEEDSATLTGSSPPLAAQTGEFGTLDEPPSLVSSISGQGMARVPSFDDLGDTAAVPGGTFGEIRDLSLISSSGISSPSLTGVGPSSEEMDTNQQPAPVLAMKGAPPPSIPEIPFGPMAEFTPRPAPSPAVPLEETLGGQDGSARRSERSARGARRSPQDDRSVRRLRGEGRPPRGAGHRRSTEPAEVDRPDGRLAEAHGSSPRPARAAGDDPAPRPAPSRHSDVAPCPDGPWPRGLPVLAPPAPSRAPSRSTDDAESPRPERPAPRPSVRLPLPFLRQRLPGWGGRGGRVARAPSRAPRERTPRRRAAADSRLSRAASPRSRPIIPCNMHRSTPSPM
jgi:molecular chaperone DnaK